ncbi:hypothetical protein GT370_16045 [Acidocella sp. MX-AZ03]|uniref:hypothetical protein n=1 Tax=Acidocella sp. MX-AZ03 TaxID=2697363 RepID=UPI0022DE32AA|nr:hypothetical protein [Acidocella sp. MX-AZ03]WBO58650.1 hypothetical protein GT370_16045 [Acidocella sp. MX-AZ03]
MKPLHIDKPVCAALSLGFDLDVPALIFLTGAMRDPGVPGGPHRVIVSAGFVPKKDLGFCLGIHERAGI